MKLHEYQAKEILKRHGLKTLENRNCFNLKQVKEATAALGFPCAIKAQVHAGGRGKGGGVKIAKNSEDALAFSERILGSRLVTPQTDKNGQLVNSVLVEQGCAIAQELYVGIVVDREKGKVCVMASQAGGVDIEEVAAHSPEMILKEWVDPAMGLMPYQARNLAFGLEAKPEVVSKIVKTLLGLYSVFESSDAAIAEINPLVITADNDVIALDAKLVIDDNALYRQPDIAKMHDPSQEDAREVEAQHHGLSYVALDGNIGCMVNGAGLAMATMDIIKHVGGAPANFLDVGGSATQERVTEALKIILRDAQVKAVLINVFGGIAKCDVIANGVVEAAKQLGLRLPLVVRLEGTNVLQGKQILKDSGLKIVPADNMLDAAKKAVELASNQ